MENNPCLRTVLEAIKLDPNAQIATVVSLGTGELPKLQQQNKLPLNIELNFSINMLKSLPDYLDSFIEKITSSTHLLDAVQTICNLKNATLFRLSPPLQNDIALNETDEKKLLKMIYETRAFIYKNSSKIDQICNQLLRDI